MGQSSMAASKTGPRLSARATFRTGAYLCLGGIEPAIVDEIGKALGEE